MSNILQRLAQNDTEREELRAFFIDYLQRMAIDQVFKRGQTEYLADAGDCIEGSFEELTDLYSPKPNKKNDNPAR